MEGRNENGGKVCHRHHSGESKRVVVKIESRRFLIFRPSSEWPNAKRGPFPRKGYETKSYPIRGNGPLFAFRQKWEWKRNVSVYGKVSRYGVHLSRKADFIPYFGKGNVQRNGNGGEVFHTHHNGQSESVVVKSESKRFLII